MTDEHLRILLSALADIRRRQIIEMKLNPHTEEVYSDAYVYAILHSVHPINHEAEELGEGENPLVRFPFRNSYRVPYEQVHEVAEILDLKWRSGEEVTFYDVESPYRVGGKVWRGVDPRSDLIHVCRYLFLSRLFNESFWSQFMSESPAEASGVTDSWNRDDLLDWSEAG